VSLSSLVPDSCLATRTIADAIETAETAETAVVVLNSIHGDCDDAVQNISFYLKEELLKKKGVNIEKNDLLCVVPQCPQQDHGSSCGIYLLHFAEMILSR
jgi:Ulp1 family protease